MTTTKFKRKTYDAVIIGARCSGAATAMLLARAGLRVLVVDRDAPDTDTVSTHGIMAPGVALLAKWGLLPKLLETSQVIGGFSHTYGSEEMLLPIREIPGAPGLIAPRRWILDWALADAAKTAGAEVVIGMRCVGVLRGVQGDVNGARFLDQNGNSHEVRAQLVIGADGRTSGIAQQVGAQVVAKTQNRVACAYTYLDKVPNHGFQWFFDPDSACGIIPSSHGTACVFGGTTPDRAKALFADGALLGLVTLFDKHDPVIAARLVWQDVQERPRRFGGAPGHIRQAAGPGWALVGDARFYKDPVTGHGITDAFMDAQRLSDAVIANPSDLSSYMTGRATADQQLLELTDRIASFNWDFDGLKVLHQALAGQVAQEVKDCAGFVPSLAA